MIETHFAFSEPLREHRETFAFETSLDPGEFLAGPAAAFVATPTITVEYTDEVVHAMCAAEETLIAEAKGEIEERFAD